MAPKICIALEGADHLWPQRSTANPTANPETNSTPGPTAKSTQHQHHPYSKSNSIANTQFRIKTNTNSTPDPIISIVRLIVFVHAVHLHHLWYCGAFFFLLLLLVLLLVWLLVRRDGDVGSAVGLLVSRGGNGVGGQESVRGHIVRAQGH